MGALIKDGEEDKYRIRSNGGKIIVRLSEKVVKNHTIRLKISIISIIRINWYINICIKLNESFPFGLTMSPSRAKDHLTRTSIKA